MQAMLEREQKRRIRDQSVNARPSASHDNWLFICDRCGQPIRYNEPLQVNCAKGAVEVAHMECPLR